MMLYLCGWGFKVDLLAYYIPIGKYDAVAWSLGIVRLIELLRRRNLAFRRVLLISCPYKMDDIAVERFVEEYQKDPQNGRYRFYRKCLWGSNVDWHDVERFFNLTGNLEQDKDLLEELMRISRTDLDLQLLADRCEVIDLVLTKNDLIVPYHNQIRLAREIDLYHDNINIYELNTGHYPFPQLADSVLIGECERKEGKT